jgi:hypothetical protein
MMAADVRRGGAPGFHVMILGLVCTIVRSLLDLLALCRQTKASLQGQARPDS